MGWGMHPDVLIERQLRAGTLVELLPGNGMDMPLYWVHARSVQAGLKRLTQCVLAAAREWLQPSDAALRRVP